MSNQTPPSTDPILRVEHLVKHYATREGPVRAVDDISFAVRPRETLGLVGESGCGKTTVGRTVLGLLEPTAGRVAFEGRDLFKLPHAALRALRRDLQIIFQDPHGSLHPRRPAGAIIGEGLTIHRIGRPDERREAVRDIMAKCGLPPEWEARYPHEFSGGQKQRIGIARALATRPKFVVCDEPVSALDMSVRSQIINLLAELKDALHLTYLFISHDLSVVEHLCDRVAVMYLGRLVEVARRETLFAHPLHPYTRALLSAIPTREPGRARERIVLEGDVPSPIHPPSGCRFHPRCPLATDTCRRTEPPRREVDGHAVWCHLAEA